MTVRAAVIAAPVVPGPAAMYLTIANSGQTPDTLVAVRVGGQAAEIHRQLQGSGLLVRMEPVPLLEIPGDSTVSMAPGGTHVMLDAERSPIIPGDTIQVEMTFRKIGTLTAPAVVVGYDELQAALGVGGTAGPPHH